MKHSLRSRISPAATSIILTGILTTLALTLGSCGQQEDSRRTILNVSYDPTREFYREYNERFVEHWKETTGEDVAITMSHGGSGSQARAVIDGLEADVVTLALAHDIDAIALHGQLLSQDWIGTLPNNNAPYVSALAFLVRKGNPKNITDWDDLVREGVSVITPNPKTSGVARWNYLAAWGYSLRKDLGPDFVEILRHPERKEEAGRAQERAFDFVHALYRNVPVLDRAARAATNTFIQRKIGDVLINWENEILLGSRELDEAGLEVVIPSVSILAEPTVAVVRKNSDRRGGSDLAEAYLRYLYDHESQEIIARNYYRPWDQNILERHRQTFPDLELFTIADVFGGWGEANRLHFVDGGTFDQLYLEQ
ncbi:sulfate transport system substrate-binding protein [Alkalispirochaeta americana]|uniref:Sulfate transport system substrate-binding protein n=1 Tax=Alkalispirochaeta americana TaxID=159291 RepID=A0A1N6T0G4_9SPIO|nr:sulfate ABC transporter substrate-binding protein [Alkalispirochaeta americana]SIQ46727.1 sulfate transport system substrate-binding protein [Alkalispirochaeta americana]